MKIFIFAVCFVTMAAAALGQTPPANPEARYDEILAEVQKGNLEEALTLLETLEREMDLPVQLAGLKGALYVETGNPRLALETLGPLAAKPDAEPAVLYNAGRAALAVGDLQLAEAYLQRSFDMHPESPAARDLGVLLAQTGRCRDAYKLLRPWAANQPEDIEARIIGAFCALQLSRPADAKELLTDLDRDNPQVALLWGKLLLDTSDPHGTVATLEPLAQDPPPELELDILRTLAEALAAVGRAAESVEILAGHEGGNPSIALQLAQAKYQSGDMIGATETLESYADAALRQAAVSESQPNKLQASLIIEYGRLLVTGGRYAEALPYLEAAVELAPDNKQSWQQLGQAYAAAGRRDEAQEALKRFQTIVESEVPATAKVMQVEEDSKDPTGRELRVALKAFADGKTDEALAILKAETELSPGDPRPLLLAARFLLITEQANEALTLADQAVGMAPEYADAHYVRGTVLMGMLDLSGAEAEFRRALELAPDHTATMNDLAVLLMESDRSEEARTLLERVLELQPEDALAASNLESLGGS